MDIKVDRDTIATNGMCVPEGTVLKDVKEHKNTYRGMWSSRFGSYVISVKKSACIAHQSLQEHILSMLQKHKRK